MPGLPVWNEGFPPPSEADLFPQAVFLSLTESDEDGEGQIDVPVPAPDEKISDFLALKQIISQLDDTEKKLIELRYFKNLTQSRTADILGMTQVQVSRKEKKLLLKMREKLME